MSWRILAQHFLFLAFIPAQPVHAQPPCGLKGPSQVSGVNHVLNQIEESPFAVACKKPGLLKNRPPFNFLARGVVSQDRQGRKTQDFLKKIINKVRQKNKESQSLIENIRACTETAQKKLPACAEIQVWSSQALGNAVKEARYNLSLAQSENQFLTWVGVNSGHVNSGLKTLGSYKYAKWAPLTKEEEKTAQKTLDEYQAETQVEIKKQIQNHQLKPDQAKKFERDSLIAVRYEHYQKYRESLSNFPIIQHLKGPGVTPADLKQALHDMEAKLKEERDYLSKWESMLTKNSSPPLEVLNLLNYSSLVEETLQEDEGYCGLATSLVLERKDLDVSKTLALTLPTMVVSFFAAPVVIAGVGVVSGGIMAGQSYKDLRRKQTQSLGSVYKRNDGELEALEDSFQQLKIDVVTLPMGLGLGNILTKSAVQISSKSFLLAKRLVKPFTAVR